MKKTLAWLGAGAIVGALAFAMPAQAVKTVSTEVKSLCGRTGWYVNPDETDRKPKATMAGLKFKGDDLIHRATNTALADLTPGTFALADGSAEPDQPSFFSVEVRDTNDNYGTLRWNGSEWSITINAGTNATAGTFTDANPVTLLTDKRSKWGSANFDTSATTVVSFGVGYTKNPPGTVTTIVKSVSFGGTDYQLDCTEVTTEKPEVTPATCNSAGTVKLPNTKGVNYTATDVEDGKVVVTATAEDGYKLNGDTKWTLEIPAQLSADHEKCVTESPDPEPPTTESPSPDPTETEEPTPTPTVTESPSASPSVKPEPTPPSSPEPTVSRSPVAGLPLTGENKVKGVVLTGLALFAAGAFLIAFTIKRRRDEAVVED